MIIITTLFFSLMSVIRYTYYRNILKIGTLSQQYIVMMGISAVYNVIVTYIEYIIEIFFSCKKQRIKIVTIVVIVK